MKHSLLLLLCFVSLSACAETVLPSGAPVSQSTLAARTTVSQSVNVSSSDGASGVVEYRQESRINEDTPAAPSADMIPASVQSDIRQLIAVQTNAYDRGDHAAFRATFHPGSPLFSRVNEIIDSPSRQSYAVSAVIFKSQEQDEITAAVTVTQESGVQATQLMVFRKSGSAWKTWDMRPETTVTQTVTVVSGQDASEGTSAGTGSGSATDSNIQTAVEAFLQTYIQAVNQGDLQAYQQLLDEQSSLVASLPESFQQLHAQGQHEILNPRIVFANTLDSTTHTTVLFTQITRSGTHSEINTVSAQLSKTEQGWKILMLTVF